MRAISTSMVLAAVCAVTPRQAAAVDKPVAAPVLYGTTGACNNTVRGGPCTTTESVFVQLDPSTGALLRTIGPVGFVVNGLAWDPTSDKLYATTPVGELHFHGLITIDPRTGKGTPVNGKVVNFGLAGDAAPVHSIAIDRFGQLVGWYDEFPAVPGVGDTFVRINKRKGVATEFPQTGIDTSGNGVAFQAFPPLGLISILWNIDSPRFDSAAGTLVQTAYVIDPSTGKPFAARTLSPPTNAALGDFHPQSNLYYGLDFDQGSPATSIVVVDPLFGTVTTLGPTVDDLHVIAFVKPLL